MSGDALCQVNTLSVSGQRFVCQMMLCVSDDALCQVTLFVSDDALCQVTLCVRRTL